jgi:hypothetical protein
MRSMRVPCRRESAYPVVRTCVRISMVTWHVQNANLQEFASSNPAMDSPRSSLNLLPACPPITMEYCVILLNPRVAQAENARTQIFAETGAALASGC